MERCSASLALRRMQSKTTLTYLLSAQLSLIIHFCISFFPFALFTPTRMAIIKKQQQIITSVDTGMGNLEFSYITGGNVNATPTLENSLAFPKRVNVGLPHDIGIFQS